MLLVTEKININSDPFGLGNYQNSVIDIELQKSDFFYKDDFGFIDLASNKSYVVETESPVDIMIHGLLDREEYDSYLQNYRNDYIPVIIPTAYNKFLEKTISFGYYIEEKDLIIMYDKIFSMYYTNFDLVCINLHKFKDISFLNRYLYIMCKNIVGNRSLKRFMNPSIPTEFKQYIQEIESLE